MSALKRHLTKKALIDVPMYRELSPSTLLPSTGDAKEFCQFSRMVV